MTKEEKQGCELMFRSKPIHCRNAKVLIGTFTYLPMLPIYSRFYGLKFYLFIKVTHTATNCNWSFLWPFSPNQCQRHAVLLVAFTADYKCRILCTQMHFETESHSWKQYFVCEELHWMKWPSKPIIIRLLQPFKLMAWLHLITFRWQTISVQGHKLLVCSSHWIHVV